MANSVNHLLGPENDSEFEDDIVSEIDNACISLADNKPFLSARPTDRYNIAYIIFYILGINTLIPWSFFITANDYWLYKFRDIHPNNTGVHKYTHSEITENKTDLQASFTSYLNVASAIPNTLFLILNTFLSQSISQRTRIIAPQSMILILFIITTTCVEINTDEWQDLFLIITLGTVAIINSLCAICGGTLLGIIGRFPPNYITAMSGGQALGGIFTALTEICALWVGASSVISGLVYFIIGDVILFASLVSYLFIERLDFFKYYMIQKPRVQESNFSVNAEVSFVDDGKASHRRIFWQIWPYGFSMFLVFFVSMAVYPGVTVLVESQNKGGEGNDWNNVYFVPVITYLLFSCGDYVGRLLSGLLVWPKRKPLLLVGLSLSRILFIPAFMVCNAQPRHFLPVYITNDIYYVLLTIFFSIGNGYLCNITFILAPTVVDPQDKEIASTMMGAFLGLGLTIGSAVSLVLVKIL